MYDHTNHRRRKRLSRLLRPLLAVLVTAPTLGFGAAALVGNPTAAVAAEDFVNILPPSSAQVEFSNLDGDIGPIPMPDCGSRNVAPQSTFNGSLSEWDITSEIGSGSTVFVGQEWTVTGGIRTTAMNEGTLGNDGADPLNLDLIPQGPVESGAAPVGSEYPGGGPNTYHPGPGATGPKAARGAWGYAFDQNSNLEWNVFGGDGTNAIVTVTLRANAVGEIQMKKFDVTGHDGTPTAGAVDCQIDLNWYWKVIEIEDPIAKLDFVTTDASYEPVVAGYDRTTGRHGVWVDVLANDDDPNENYGCDGECGIDPDEDIRIQSWGTGLDCGDDNLNGVIPTVANFDSLPIGPCLYTPTPGAENHEEVSYTMVQRSGLRTATSSVLTTLINNFPPTINDAEGELTAGDQYVFQFGGFVDEPDANENATCMTDSVQVTPVIASLTVSIDPNCQVTWETADNENFVGAATLTYVACDLHSTLSDAALGAARGPNYSLHVSDPAKNDLSATTTRRCATGKAVFDVKAPGPLLAPPFQAVNDYDVLDRAYPDDGIGPFHLDIDVALNDVSFAGATNVTVGPYGGGYPPSMVIITYQNKRIQVTSTATTPKVLTIGYRICGTFGAQGTRCATAKVIITVIHNLAPIAQDDLFGVTPKAPSQRDVKANDLDPEDGVELTCDTDNHPWGPKQPVPAFDAVDVSADCVVSFDAADDFTGDAYIEYQVCDAHILATPKWARSQQNGGYGPLNTPPGLPAHRCTPGLARFTFTDYKLVLPPAVEVVPNVPTCVADAFQTKADTAAVVNVLANDSDLTQENQPGALTLPPPAEEVTTQGGFIAVVGDQLQYTPKPGFTGVDAGNYNVLDSDGNGCSAVVTFTVILDNDNDGIPDVLPQPQPTDPTVPPGGQLPATGSSTGPTAAIAFGALVLGLGLVVLASRRRRSQLSA
ncbi:MAG: Ig-like domain-containing protein [Ilumatobacteraceae bacterium]